jgi:selenocysteine lyase/cysteine desulfurase
MPANYSRKSEHSDNDHHKDSMNPAILDNRNLEAFAELERGVQAALETYSNVQRGSGHNSMVTTHLYEHARDVVLEYLGLKKDKYEVIFCTPRRAELLKVKLKTGSYRSVSSQDIGLPLGVRALAVKKNEMPTGVPFQTGGGTVRLVSPGWVIWAKAPDKFEAGTPAIVNIIAFAIALQLIRQFGKDAFQQTSVEGLTAGEILNHDGLEESSGRELLGELRQTLIGRGVRVPTLEGETPFINLDNGASTPTFRPIWDAVCQTWRQPIKVQEEIIHEVKAICARFLGAPQASYDVTFTSNTTEAINLVAESLQNEFGKGNEPVVLNTLLEHNSNELPWRMTPGLSMLRLPVDGDGFMDLVEMETLLREYNREEKHGNKHIKVVAVSGASNVLGVFNDLAEIGQIVHRYGARLLVDAAQLVAHRKVDMEACGIDYLAFSAHKAYAPFGTGVLMVKKGLLHFNPVELNLIKSSGEENTAGIAALGKAFLLLERIGLNLIQKEEQAMTARALRGLARIPDLKIYGIKDPDSSRFAKKGGVIIFSLKDILPSRVAKELAEKGGIGVRYGCHCAHLLIKRLLNISPFLQQFQGLILSLGPKIVLPGVVRVSLGIENSPEDIDTLIQVLDTIARQPRAGKQNGTPNQPRADIQQQMDDFTKAAALRVYVQPGI